MNETQRRIEMATAARTLVKQSMPTGASPELVKTLGLVAAANILAVKDHKGNPMPLNPKVVDIATTRDLPFPL